MTIRSAHVFRRTAVRIGACRIPIRLLGEHLHPAIHEGFTVLQGELTMIRDGQRSTLYQAALFDKKAKDALRYQMGPEVGALGRQGQAPDGVRSEN